jgi:hypothetical protein
MAKSPKQTIKDAPVTTITTVESVVGFVLTFLVAHGIIGNIDVAATTQTVAPFIALAVPALFGAVKWRLVTPWEKAKDVTDGDGLMSDADYARIDAMVKDRIAPTVPRHQRSAAMAGQFDGIAVAHHPGGMAAGAVRHRIPVNGRR